MKSGIALDIRVRCLVVSISCAMICLVATMHANAQRVGVYSDLAGENPCIEVQPGQPIDLYVVITPSPGYPPQTVSSIQFGDLTASWDGSGVFPADLVPLFPVTYLPRSEFRLDFGACLTLPLHVLTIRAICSFAPQDCRRLWVDAVAMRDCADQPMQFIDGYDIGNPVDTICGLLPLSDAYPPDGATLVPNDVVLTWGDLVGQSTCVGPDQFGVSFGTSPDPNVVWMGWDQFYDPPGTLRENTMYYWRVAGLRPGVGETTTPVFSFITGPGTVTVERSTWGMIKALYR